MSSADLRWAFDAVDRSGERALSLRWSLRDRCAVSAVAFERGRRPVAASLSLPRDEAGFVGGGVHAGVGPCVLARDGARVALGAGPQRLACEVAFSGSGAGGDVAPSGLSRLLGAGIASPMVRLAVDGTATVRGEVWPIAGWHGALTSRSAALRPRALVSGSCSVWQDGLNAAFGGGTERLRVAGAPVDARVLSLTVDGARHAFGRVTGDVSMRRWRFEAPGQGASLRGEIWADTADFAGLREPFGPGDRLFSLVSLFAQARIELTRPGHAPLVLRSTCAALEIGTRDPNHGIEIIA